jgi:hypothetical protein
MGLISRTNLTKTFIYLSRFIIYTMTREYGAPTTAPQGTGAREGQDYYSECYQH